MEINRLHAETEVYNDKYYFKINDKNCCLPIVLTDMDQKLQTNHKNVILPTITSSKCQRDAE